MAFISFTYDPVTGALADIVKNRSRASEIVMEEIVSFGNAIGPVVLGDIQGLTPVRTGDLKASEQYATLVTAKDIVTTEWSSEILYAPFVEDGTSKMQARGMFKGGLAMAQADIDKLMNIAAQNIADKLEG